MKKTLLLSTALFVGVASFAQSNKYAKLANKPVSAKDISRPSQEVAFPGMTTKNFTGPATTIKSKSSALCTPQRFTACINGFGVGGSTVSYQQNCLSYNKDLNTVLWTHRISEDWAFTGKTSGCIQSTWLNVSTGNWDSLMLYRDSSTNKNAARFPGGIIFNPTGNTSISGAYMVGSGPCTGNGTPAWIGSWYNTRQPSGNYHSLPPVMKNFVAPGAAPFGDAGYGAANAGQINLDMQQVGQTVMVGAALYDYTNTAGDVKGGIIGKGVYSGGTWTWGADSIAVGFYQSPTLGLISDGLGGRLAFDPTGTTGYWVFNGRLATNFNNNADSTIMPIVYKTTNSGATWTRVLDGYDWTCSHPEILKNVGALLPSPGVHPTPNIQHGVDLTVDANGVLHYVTTITMPYQDGRYAGGGYDSLQYTYTYKWDYINNHPVIWDLMTDGTDWKTMLVDSIATSYMAADPAGNDSTAVNNAWAGTGGTNLAYGAHLTVSRSTDGTKIFYGWGDSDPSSTGNQWNTAPDLWMRAYDVTSGKLAPLTNVTNGISTCFFSYLSDVSYYDAGMSMWVVPFVYQVGRFTTGPGVYDGSKAVDFYYGTCAMYDNSSFTQASTIYSTGTYTTHVAGSTCAVGVQSHNSLSSSVSNYPNPFNGSTKIVVKLAESKAISLNVFDAIGNIVYTQKANGNIGENTFVFDGSNLTAGVYYYTVTAGYEKVTKKMVIQK